MEEDDFEYEEEIEDIYSDNGALGNAIFPMQHPSDSTLPDNSIYSGVNDNLVYTIEATSDEQAIARLASTLTNYSLNGPLLDSYTYSDEDDMDERDTESSSLSGEHFVVRISSSFIHS